MPKLVSRTLLKLEQKDWSSSWKKNPARIFTSTIYFDGSQCFLL